MNLHNTSTRIINLSSLALAIIIIAGGCAQTETIEIEREFNAPKISKAVAVLHPTDGFDAKGTIYFTAVENGVQVTADISGLSEGNKGFHIHQYGDCTAANDYVDKTIHINMILGRGVIVHNGEDDLSSQPSGAAGPRVACGVIGVASASE